MRTTERIRFSRLDIVEFLEWATPLGSITFEPLDNDYQNADPSNRVFTATIENPNEEAQTITATDKELIKTLNKMIKDKQDHAEEARRKEAAKPRLDRKYKTMAEYRQAIKEGRE